MNTVRETGSRLDPFIDDWLIDRMDGVSLRLHQSVPKEISFRFDQPWEGMSSIFVRVMKGGDVYRNWYTVPSFKTTTPASPDVEPYKAHPLISEGDELVLNYATSADGSIRVEVQNAQGAPFPGRALADCDERFGDDIERVVRWHGDANVSDLEGRPVRLRVTSTNYADFYSIRFGRSD